MVQIKDIVPIQVINRLPKRLCSNYPRVSESTRIVSG